MKRTLRILPADPALWSFGQFVEWHFLHHGTRPDRPRDSIGKPWTPKDAAKALGISIRGFWNWIDDAHLPYDATAIERVLFGNGTAFDDERKNVRKKLELTRLRNAEAAKAAEAAPPDEPAPFPPINDAGRVKTVTPNADGRSSSEADRASAPSQPNVFSANSASATSGNNAQHQTVNLGFTINFPEWERRPDSGGWDEPDAPTGHPPTGRGRNGPAGSQPGASGAKDIRSGFGKIGRILGYGLIVAIIVIAALFAVDAWWQASPVPGTASSPTPPAHPEAPKAEPKVVTLPPPPAVAPPKADPAPPPVKPLPQATEQPVTEADIEAQAQRVREENARAVAGLGLALRENTGLNGSGIQSTVTDTVVDCAALCSQDAACAGFVFFGENAGGSRSCNRYMEPVKPYPASGLTAAIRSAKAPPGYTTLYPGGTGEGVSRCSNGFFKVDGFALSCERMLGGGDIPNTPLRYQVATIGECAAKCRVVGACAGFSFDASQLGPHDCQIFGKSAQSKIANGWVSGTRQ